MICKRTQCPRFNRDSCRYKIIKQDNKDIILTCGHDDSIIFDINISGKYILQLLNALDVAKAILDTNFPLRNYLPAEQVAIAIQLIGNKEDL